MVSRTAWDSLKKRQYEEFIEFRCQAVVSTDDSKRDEYNDCYEASAARKYHSDCSDKKRSLDVLVRSRI